jgi:hypothetical protein
MNDPELGYCGLYCGGCQAYQETQAGLRTTFQRETQACEGCASSGVVASWCRDCEIKACARRKGLRYCLPCDEYPCAKLQAFVNDPRYPYHRAVHSDMVRLREVGTETWLREQATRWACRTCGNKYHWFERKCASCGTRVNAEYWPD